MNTLPANLLLPEFEIQTKLRLNFPKYLETCFVRGFSDAQLYGLNVLLPLVQHPVQRLMPAYLNFLFKNPNHTSAMLLGTRDQLLHLKKICVKIIFRLQVHT